MFNTQISFECHEWRNSYVFLHLLSSWSSPSSSSSMHKQPAGETPAKLYLQIKQKQIVISQVTLEAKKIVHGINRVISLFPTKISTVQENSQGRQYNVVPCIFDKLSTASAFWVRDDILLFNNGFHIGRVSVFAINTMWSCACKKCDGPTNRQIESNICC